MIFLYLVELFEGEGSPESCFLCLLELLLFFWSWYCTVTGETVSWLEELFI
jgi:hypothetical protein